MQKRPFFNVLFDTIEFGKIPFCQSEIFHQKDRKIVYLHTHNMAKACLLDNRSGIAEIAERCGYQDLSSFNHQFNIHAGMTPREYRKRSKGA